MKRLICVLLCAAVMISLCSCGEKAKAPSGATEDEANYPSPDKENFVESNTCPNSLSCYGGGNISFSASTLSASGNTTIGGTLIVGTASVNKATTLNGTLNATGNTTIGGTLNVGTSSAKRATTLNGTLTITDTTTAQNIVSGGTASTTGRYDIGTSSNY